MKKSAYIIISIFIIGMVAFFFPKDGGSGGTCAGCEIRSCQCMGIARHSQAVGPVEVTCYGIPHSCTTGEVTPDTTQANTNVQTIPGTMDDVWICDGKDWVKQGNPTDPKPTDVCDADHAALPLDNPLEFNWSTMDRGPYRDRITYALSNDLRAWSARGVMLADHASVPGAVFMDGTIFVYFVDVSQDGIKEQLGMVMSDDEGATWTEQRTLTIDGLGDRAPADPAPVVLDDGRIRLYFFDINEARMNKPASGIEPTNKIYSAISNDGIHFAMEEGIRFERRGIFDPDVEHFGDSWYLYGGDIEGNQVIYATSDDGLTFTEGGIAYQGGAVPDVYYHDGTYYLFTAGIGIATGTTPTSFTATGDQFTDPSSPGATADPSVVPLSNGFYLMVYKIQE